MPCSSSLASESHRGVDKPPEARIRLGAVAEVSDGLPQLLQRRLDGYHRAGARGPVGRPVGYQPDGSAVFLTGCVGMNRETSANVNAGELVTE
jgi:hypothetical protein